MLILTASVNESIRLHTLEGVVTVMVCGVKGGQVKLGITAPKTVTVLRGALPQPALAAGVSPSASRAAASEWD